MAINCSITPNHNDSLTEIEECLPNMYTQLVSEDRIQEYQLLWRSYISE